jgi:DNA-binding transcriptional ArsR family regulator
MVEQSAVVDAVFHALAHPARRDMVGRLAERERTVGELAAPLAMSLAAASKHIKVLESAGLIDRQVVGRQHVCRFVPRQLHEASAWLRYYDRFWTDRLDGLQAMFDTEPADDGPRKDHGDG